MTNMTKNLFEKAACFGDIHFGKRSNSDDHNLKCLNFVKWFCKEAKEWGAETCIFLGDWHDSRVSLHVKTMNYSFEALKLLSETFETVYFMIGNHDIYHRSKRDFNSIVYTENFKNIKTINKPTTSGNVTLLPFLVGDEYKKLKKVKSKYVFGHLELPNFRMNSNIRMADVGELKASDFKEPDYVFSGHFHPRQNNGNVWYIGNTFPMTFHDVNDDERGGMFLEWGKEPFFKSWPEQPIYRIYNLSEILDEPEKYIVKHSTVQIVVDMDLTFEESISLKEGFINSYDADEITFVQKTTELEETEWSGDVKFQSVDQIVVDGINSIDEEDGSFEIAFLLDIYNNLEAQIGGENGDD